MRTEDVVLLELDRLNRALKDAPVGDIRPHTGPWIMRRNLIELRDRAVEELRLIIMYKSRPVVDFLFDGGAAGRDSIDAGFLGRQLQRLQDTLNALGQAILESPRRTGPISNEVRDAVRLRVAGTAYGSFGLVLEGPPLGIETALAIDDDAAPVPPLETTIRQVMSLIQKAAGHDGTDDDLFEAASSLTPRAIAPMMAIAKDLADSGSRLKVAWQTPFAAREQVEVGQIDASRLASVLADIETSHREDSVSGRLDDLALTRDQFGLLLDDGRVMRGRVEKSIREEVARFFHQQCTVVLAVDVIRSRVTGRVVEHNTLVEIGPSPSSG